MEIRFKKKKKIVIKKSNELINCISLFYEFIEETRSPILLTYFNQKRTSQQGNKLAKL